MRTRIHTLHTDPSLIGTILTIKGWVRTVRDQKTFAFIELNDGSCLANLQVIVPSEVNFSQVTTGAAISVVGKLIASPGKNQSVELQANDLEIIGTCPAEDYPLQKKTPLF